MKNSKYWLFIYILTIFSLTGCSFNTLKSILNSEYEEFIGESVSVDENRDLGYSLELLDNAFNSKVNNNNESLLMDFSTITKNNEFDGAKRLNITSNILDCEYNDYLTPSTGSINSLVIPVEFKDALANPVSNNKTQPTYQSVSSYYYNTSYGQLEMNFDIVDWQMMKYKSNYYENLANDKFYGDAPGASAIIHEALTKLEKEIDLTKYDNDNDGVIDSLYIIYSKDIDAYSNLWWAFQYTTYETTTYDGVEAGFYVFAGYDFLFDDNESCNTKTFIHETGHMFGLDDYYDYDEDLGYSKGSVGGVDMMDFNLGDHNPFSKLCVGWIKDPILIELEKGNSTTITINSFDYNGDTIMICDNFDETLGLYQNYFLIQYINPDSILNKNQVTYTKNGIKVYRIHGEFENFTEDGQEYSYFKYDNSYTKYNLLDAYNNSTNPLYSSYEYMDICASDNDLFLLGDYCKNLSYFDTVSTMSSYSFKVISIGNETATLEFYRN